jgi:hypothetical protein
MYFHLYKICEFRFIIPSGNSFYIRSLINTVNSFSNGGTFHELFDISLLQLTLWSQTPPKLLRRLQSLIYSELLLTQQSVTHSELLLTQQSVTHSELLLTQQSETHSELLLTQQSETHIELSLRLQRQTYSVVSLTPRSQTQKMPLT